MLLAELRYAFRLIRVRPASAAAVILTLAVAIGAVSTLFTIVNAALLAPLPVHDPDRLVNVYSTDPDGSGFGALSFPDFEDLAASGLPAAGLAGYSGVMATVTGEQSSEVVFGEIVTPSYFPVLGVEAALGRTFSDEDARGGQPVVVISDRLWRRRFEADPAAVGSALSLNGRAYTVIGVAPAAFPGLLFRGLSADLWAPVWTMGQLRTDQRANRGERWMFVKGRVRPGGSVEELQAAALAVGSRLQQAYPATNRGRTFRLVPTAEVMVHPEADRAVGLAAAGVMGASVLVLLVACANVAGVMLARGLGRRRELAIRGAIGARRVDLVRQVLVEGAVLGFLGGAGGLLVARWAAAALAAWRPDLPVPVSLDVGLDWRVAAFTVALTTGATVAFALMPALRASRIAPAGSSAPERARTRRAFGLRDALLVPQLSLAVMLLTVAGLFTRSLARADSVDPGFDAGRTAYVSLNLAMSGYDDARARRFYLNLSEALARDAGVEGAALTARVPLDLYGSQSVDASADGTSSLAVQTGAIAPGYFDVMGIRVVRGRSFTGRDAEAGAPAVAVVSAAAARRFWGGRDPIGRELRLGPRRATVVGVAADVKVQALGESPVPFVYEPIVEGHARLLRLVFRTGAPAAAVGRVRQLVRAEDPAVAVFDAGTMAEHVETMMYPYRAAAALGSVLGAIAIVLAGIGLYGVLACGVAERLRELAIRLALGAPSTALVRSALVESVRATAIGLVAGVGLALLAGRLLANVLFGISPADPVTLAAVAGVLAAVVAAASAAPVRRAIRVDPMQILRM